MTKRYLGNIITQNPTAPAGDLSNSAAKGVWSLEEQLAYQKAGLWPVAGNFPPDVEDVFSTYLYTGTASNQTITNGIDLSGEGGLVWIKGRTNAQSHGFFDTERGVNKALVSDANWAEFSYQGVNAFNSNGFQVGYQNEYNQNTLDYASWTFRKAPKFFDVVTYTGDGVAGRTISHNLGSVPGMIIIKGIDSNYEWSVYHRGVDSTAPEDYYLWLNHTSARADSAGYWNDTAPTSTEFTLGNNGNVNSAVGGTYIAYLFAHNDGDGGFGPDGDADIIKCGSYTGNGSTDGVTVDLGFEPQWLLFKDTTNSNDWIIVDNMRGMVVDNDLANADAYLRPNLSNQEGASTIVEPTSTGFKVQNNGWTDTSGANIIYIAIRRGTKVPESATEVFAPNFYGTSGYVGYLGAPADMHLLGYRNGNSQNAITSSRLIQGNKALVTSSNAAEITSNSSWDNMLGVTPVGTTLTTLISYTWKRARGFFDVLAYTGTGANRTISHNLGVAPEMIFFKKRSGADNWPVYLQSVGNTAVAMYLNETYAAPVSTNIAWFNNTSPTASEITLGFGGAVNQVSQTFVAYLFASLPGISQVGSASHSGTTNVDCGFTSGARFVLLKRTDASGDWYIWDSERGIVSGNDPYLLLNSTAAEVTNTDYIDPLASGFTITSNFTAGDYIFYAIA